MFKKFIARPSYEETKMRHEDIPSFTMHEIIADAAKNAKDANIKLSAQKWLDRISAQDKARRETRRNEKQAFAFLVTHAMQEVLGDNPAGISPLVLWHYMTGGELTCTPQKVSYYLNDLRFDSFRPLCGEEKVYTNPNIPPVYCHVGRNNKVYYSLSENIDSIYVEG